MDAAKEFLADEVLGEKKAITYRYLSRALKVHVNVAKRALFDFHTAQNAKKAGSLHATYLLYGTKQAVEVASHAQNQNGSSGEEDVDMKNGLSGHLQSDKVPTAVMTLVAEENLESMVPFMGALSQYTTLSAIHVYSVSPQPMSDLGLLADSVRQLHELRGANAPDEEPKTFGTIPNSHVQRRQRKGQGPFTGGGGGGVAAAAAGSSAIAPAAAPAPAKAASKSALSDAPGPNSIWNKVKAAPAKEEGRSAASSPKPTATAEPAKPIAAASSSAAAAPPALKKAGSSGGGSIMQAFAKGGSAAKSKKKEPTPLAKKAEEEDTAMGMSDDGGDDGGDDDDVMPKAQEVTGGKSRQQRQEELRKMMEDDDDDDDDDNDAEDEKNKEDEREDTPMEDLEEQKPAEAVLAKADGPSEVVATSSGDGRRRGKRRVMRKKMIEDKDGYLVTIQEEGWESFSEDEAPPKAAPAAATPASSAPSSAPKAKKPASKPGQGSIMSFFAKK
ncbi:CDC27 protein [Sporothrix curviconia]|uniref:DNA polymerase delta subunit 3 n=1 Tax=Sporothrix curviconia TaxID=1260050 RepID=A0ABP0BFL2_9PEZI